MSAFDALLPDGDGHTPLGDDDVLGLKLSYVTTRGDLNEAEQENILRALTSRGAPSVEILLNDQYLRDCSCENDAAPAHSRDTDDAPARGSQRLAGAG